MHSVDTHFVIQQLRHTGLQLKKTFSSLQPAIEQEDMMTAFRRFDDQASGALRDALRRACPQIDWLDGELTGDAAWQHLSGGAFWVCDAIDGGVQFLRALPQWCTSLTLIVDGQPQLAIVFDAMHDEVFHAQAGGGAFLNGAPIRVNERRSHVGAVLASSQPPFIQGNAEVIRQLSESLRVVLPDAGVVRNLGPTSLQLACVACGRLDAFWEYGEDSFNCIGGALLVREAGGQATAVDGQPYRLRSPSIVAAGLAVHASLSRRLQQV